MNKVCMTTIKFPKSFRDKYPCFNNTGGPGSGLFIERQPLGRRAGVLGSDVLG